MRLFKTLFGSGIYLFWIVLAFLYNGGHLESLLHPGETAMVWFAPIGALIGAYGLGGTVKLLGASLSSRKQAALAIPHAKLGRFLSLWIVAAYGTSILAFVLGVVVTMGFVAGEAAKIGEKVASALVAFFWAILIAEGLLRPLKRRIEEEGLAGR